MDSINILTLNDDCLDEIFKYLTIAEAFQLIGTCNSRFDAAAYRRIATLKQLDISLRDFPHYTHAQLSIIGRNLRSIQLSAGYSIAEEQVLLILRPLCASGAGSTLQEITLNYINFSFKYLECLVGVAPQLRQLDLSFCQLTDALLRPLLDECVQLKNLRLLGNYTLHGDALSALHDLRLKMVEIEEHENWQFDVEAFAALQPSVLIIAHAKGRSERQEYGEGARNAVK